MYSSKFFTVAAATLALIAPSVALYDASSSANLALYWGSGPFQANISHYCEQSTVDIIPLAFMNVFPAQGNGYPAENFGNACYGQPIFTPGPGYPFGDVDTSKDQLYVQCPGIQEGIPYCQSLGKKILLSLGGASATYQLTGVADGEYFADFLWGSYGPFKQSWLDAGGIRPMDGGYYGTDPTIHVDIDGFDFDIEIAPTDSSEGYIAMINRLREHFSENPSKKYLISGAPQCPLPEQNMGAMIAGAQFDLLWIQFYNNDWAQCTARQWADNYALKGQENSAEFTHDQWVSTINSGASAGATIYLGLLGSPLAGTATDYISPLEAQSLIESYHDKPQFGGVMVWEATYSEENADAELNGQSYHAFVKSCLSPYAPLPISTISSSSSTSEVSITSTISSSIESPATSSNTPSISSISSSISEYPAEPSSTSSESSVYSFESSAVPSSTSLESTVYPSTSSSSAFPTATSSAYSVPGYSHNAASRLTHSFKPVGSGTLPVHSSKPTDSDTFTGYSSKSTDVATGHSSKSHSSKPSSKPSSGHTAPGYSSNSTFSSSTKSTKPYPTKSVVTGTGESTKPYPTISSVAGTGESSKPYPTKSSVIGTGYSGKPYPTKSSGTGTGASTKPYPTKSSVIGTGQSSKPHPIKSSGTGVGSCKSKTKTKTKKLSTGPSGYPGSSSSIEISSTVPYGNVTYSHSRTKPASSSTSSAEGVTVSSTSASQTGSTATESTVIGSSTTDVSEMTSGSAISTGSVSSGTVSVSASGSISSGVASITSVVQYTTSTAYVTSIYIITSCAATVTDCPARIGSVTTETISSYTTVFPVKETDGSGGVVSSTSPAIVVPASTTAPIAYGTSTVYQTSFYTITSCASSVTDCPARSGHVTTETISSYTSVYPISVSNTPINIPSSEASSAVGTLTSFLVPEASSIAEVSPSITTSEAIVPSNLYTTKISTLVGSQTITISAVIAPSTITVAPVPVASTTLVPPYGAGNGTLAGTGSSSASGVTRVSKPSSYVIKAEGGGSTQTSVPSPTAITFEGSGSKILLDYCSHLIRAVIADLDAELGKIEVSKVNHPAVYSVGRLDSLKERIRPDESSSVRMRKTNKERECKDLNHVAELKDIPQNEMEQDLSIYTTTNTLPTEVSARLRGIFSPDDKPSPITEQALESLQEFDADSIASPTVPWPL
ncbi:glycoside hydrolase family 18 protein [Sclerotinia borealis F-4128]|uniref:chitinase n=1 Tax=Sclerotinia borealis (strain F-4128) TaxID=1432307 RepID=W9CRU5_SCLBF|nr:glycoside hydrolase family 18 protein [Sclerotinia borealis F-4128]